MISQFKRDQTAKIMRLSKALDLAQTVVALSADELDRRSKKTAGPDAGQLKRMSGDLMKTSEALAKVHDLTEGSGGSTVEYTLKRQRFEEKLAAAQDVNCFVKKTVPPAEKKRKALGELTNVVSEKFRLPGVAQCENTPEARRKSAKMEAEIAPLPANGKKYTALECAKILAAAKNTGGLVNAMIENGYVDVRPARLYKLRDQYWNDPTSVREFGFKGRPHLATKADVLQIAERTTEGVQSLGFPEMAAGLLELVQARRKARGVCSIGAKAPARNSVKNYMHFAMEVADLKPTESAVDKTESRFAAERSIRNAVSLAVTLGATIYRPFATTGPKPHPDDEIAAFITKAEGCNDLRLVHSSLTLNHDDLTLFINQGCADKGPTLRLASKG